MIPGPDFATEDDHVSIGWASAPARDLWAPRFAAVAAALQHLEMASVAGGLRLCGLRFVPDDDLASTLLEISSMGLHAGLVERVSAGADGYISRPQKSRGGTTIAKVAFASRPADLQTLVRGLHACDDASVGRSLGYPDCCIERFGAFWSTGRIDPTWEIATNTAAANNGRVTLTGDLSPLANIALRWFGPRAIFHLPCSFACEASVAQARRFLALGRQAGFAPEMDWLEEALGWNFHWSALFGNGEIITPVARLMFSTDGFEDLREILFETGSRPAISPPGGAFPFGRQPTRMRRSSEPTLNGFSTDGAMRVAHGRILRSLLSLYSAKDSVRLKDLGCGDGELLRRLAALAPTWILSGVELDPIAIHAARLRPWACEVDLAVADLYSIAFPARQDAPQVALISASRLQEDPERARALILGGLSVGCDFLIYSYDPKAIARMLVAARGFHGVEVSQQIVFVSASA